MKENFSGISRFVNYLVPLCLIAASWPVGRTGGVLYALGALILAGVSFFLLRNLIHQINQAEQRSCELDEQLIQSQKLAAIGELSSGIAHEINNPLAIIGQEVEWLRHLFETSTLQEEKDRGEFADSLKQIASQVDRCRDITHKLLNFARKMDPVMQAVELNKLIDDMAALVEKEAKLNNINIIREFQKDLPLVTSDPPFLRQVILNLLNNATYAIESNGTITISTKDNKDENIEGCLF
ncbi:MAG: hypothetical protein HQK56_10165 [Deltaproteobacteria bacterium]|nr:hypothetical protein [Deltaproteobacteria bacterium]